MPDISLRRMRWSLPMLLLGAVVAADLSLSSRASVAGLTVMAPLVAASLVGPRLTSVYGAMALLVWFVLAAYDQQLLPGATHNASFIRGAAIVIGAVIAVAASAARCRRDAQLRDVQDVATVAQQTILRPVPPRLGLTQLAARYRSSARDALVGGDFYEAIDSPWGVRVLIGDVRGKGLVAVRLAAEVLGAFREWATISDSLPDLLERLDTAATRRAAVGDFVTAQLVQIAPDGRCSIVTAGHPQPVMLHDGHAELLPIPITRPPLVFHGRAGLYERMLHAGDQVVLYTDGVTEARHRSDRAFFDEQRLLDALGPAADPAAAVSGLADEVIAWTRGRAVDDFAVIAVQHAPLPAPVAGDPVVSPVRVPITDAG